MKASYRPAIAPAWLGLICAVAACGGSSGDSGGAAGSGGSPPDGGALRVVAEPVNWPEGPLYVDGHVLFVAYGAHQLLRWDGTKTTELWHQPGCGPSAVARMDNGELFVTCYDSNSLAHLKADGTTIENISKDAQGNAFLGPNDFARDQKGGLYFSASGVFDPKAPVQGKVYYRSAKGDITPVADKIHYANGLVVTDGGKTLLVDEHLEAQVLAFTIADDGTLSSRKVWARMSDLAPTPADAGPTYGCDGIKTDSAGNVYIANYGGGRILITNPAGKLIHTVEVPYKAVDNLGFGPDLFGAKGAAPGPAHLEDFLYIADVKDDSAQPYPGAIFQVPNPTR